MIQNVDFCTHYRHDIGRAGIQQLQLYNKCVYWGRMYGKFTNSCNDAGTTYVYLTLLTRWWRHGWLTAYQYPRWSSCVLLVYFQDEDDPILAENTRLPVSAAELRYMHVNTSWNLDPRSSLLTPEPSRLSIWSAKDSCCKSNGTSLSAMTRSPRPLVSRPSPRPPAVAVMLSSARLSDDAPAHKALKCQVNLFLGRPPNSQWHRRPGRPRNRWVDQIRNDNNLPPADLWRRAVTVSRGHCDDNNNTDRPSASSV